MYKIPELYHSSHTYSHILVIYLSIMKEDQSSLPAVTIVESNMYTEFVITHSNIKTEVAHLSKKKGKTGTLSNIS